MKNLKQFIGIYPVSKTLRFELRPIGRTQEWIEKNRVLENDENKAADYPVVKKLIDEYHKVCIRESMKNVRLDWSSLKGAIEDYQKTKSDEANPELKGNIRDYATINELICLSNMENINAVLINDGVPQGERLVKLNQIAIQQMQVLEGNSGRNLLK